MKPTKEITVAQIEVMAITPGRSYLFKLLDGSYWVGLDDEYTAQVRRVVTSSVVVKRLWYCQHAATEIIAHIKQLEKKSLARNSTSEG